MDKIPLVDLQANYHSLKEEIDQAVHNVMNKCNFIMGQELTDLENNFAKFCDAKYAVGVDSGTSALILALKALGITNPDDEVITVANTYFATPVSVVIAGAKPVLVDCGENYLIDVDKIESAITSKTKAIMPVHLFGYPADMDKINAIAKKHDLKVIEDAAQAHGALYKGKKVGSFGDLGCFSFYPGKNLGAFGDGGIITTSNDDLYQKLKYIRNYGQTKKYHHDYIGGNYRLDTMQAAILGVKLNHLDEWNAKRRKWAGLYNEHLKDVCVCPSLALPDTVPVFHLYVVRVKNRDQVMANMEKQNIFPGIHYPIPIHKLNAFKNMNYNEQDYPIATKYADEILSLPMYPELDEEKVKRVIAAIKG